MAMNDIELGTEIRVEGNTYPLRKKFKSSGLSWDGSGWVGELTSTLRHQLSGWRGLEVSTVTAGDRPTTEDLYRDWSDNPSSIY